MIVINQGEVNTVVVTVTEKTTISNPKYLFVFLHSLTKTQNTCITADTSQYIDRYNRFLITESTTQSRLTGTLSLPYAGQWEYTIYAQTSTTNLDPTAADEIVETGICTVISGAEPYADTYAVPVNTKPAFKPTI